MQAIGRYKILKRLGGGGFGEVFLGEDPTIGRQVAIKVFKPKDENLIAFATSSDEEGLEILRARFLSEAKILASLDDEPNVVGVLDYGELDDGAPFYVMPYLPRSLSDELGKDVFDVNALEELPEAQRPRALPLERSLEVLEQLLTGLAAAHARGLIHRDIKPSNLMFSESGQIRIVDFGIAKAPDGQHSTVSHLGLGSRNYMAPEQRESAKHVDARADVYSVGRLSYRMLTGRLPVGRFADPNVAVPAIGKAMNDVILAALEEDREKRPEDASELLERFQKARKRVGQDDAGETTGTWVGQGEAAVRDELKPLRAKIAEIVGEKGRIASSDRDGLVALAAIAELDESELDRLIDEVVVEDKTLSAKRRLARVIHSRVRAQQGVLDAATLASYGSAAATIGWDRNKIQALMEQAVAELDVAPPPDKKTAEHKPSPSPSPRSRSLPLKPVGIAAGILLIVLAGGWGILEWRQAQIVAEQQEQRRAAEAEAEHEAWAAAQSADTIEVYRAYLDEWPDGLNRSEAGQRMAELEEQGQGMVAKVQNYLNRLDYRVPQTGEMDPRTESAIRSFEEAQSLPVAGMADEVLLQALQAEYRDRDEAAWADATDTDTEASYVAYRERFPEGQYVDQVDDQIAGARADARERAAWAEAEGTGTLAAYRSYLEAYVDGRHAADANAAIERLEAEQVAAERAAREAAEQRALITSIQRELKRLGKDVSVDGVAGDRTSEHILAFERATDRPETGNASESLLVALVATEEWPGISTAPLDDSKAAAFISGEVLIADWKEQRREFELETQSETLSYVIGMDIGKSLREQDLDLEIELLLAGVRSALAEESLWIPEEIGAGIRDEYIEANQSGLRYEDMEKLSYVIGVDIGRSLREQNLDLGEQILIGGIYDQLSNTPTLLSEKAALAEREAFIERRQAELKSEPGRTGAENKRLGREFLASNEQKSNVMTTGSGLQYTVLRRGSGASPGPNDRVTVHYRGQLIDGTDFDSSYARGEPASFRLNQVIPGWVEGLQLMREGAKYKFFIPSELAYREQGRPGPIGPHEVLIFEVELIAVE